MSIQDRARTFALHKARELEAEASAVGIVRSVDATEASRWLKEIATTLRAACALEEDAGYQALYAAGDAAAEAKYSAKIAELEAKVPRWIPVEERLPEPLELVLVYPNLDGPIAACRENGNWWAECDSCAGPLFNITHWMPLPSPPAEPAQEEP